MTDQLRITGLMLALATATAGAVAATPVQSFEDIQYWIGEGAQQAAMAIDWQGQDPASESLVWGYRWNGAATAQDMLLDVVAGDPRLFVKLDAHDSYGTLLAGIGYDRNASGDLPLADGTEFDSGGMAYSDSRDGAWALEPGDSYREGWQTGYWRHAVASHPQGDWREGWGLSSTAVENGQWHSFAFTQSVFDFTSVASNFRAAEPAGPLGDFNRDGIVGPADYVMWRDSLGSTVLAAGYGADADQNGTVDINDYHLWRSQVASAAPVATSAFGVPEPTTVFLLTLGLAPLLWKKGIS